MYGRQLHAHEFKNTRKENPVTVSILSSHLPFRDTPSSEEAIHRVSAWWETDNGHDLKKCMRLSTSPDYRRESTVGLISTLSTGLFISP